MENLLIGAVVINAIIAICFFVMCSNVSKIRKRVCGTKLDEKVFLWWGAKFANKSKEELVDIAEGIVEGISENDRWFVIDEQAIQTAKKMLREIKEETL